MYIFYISGKNKIKAKKNVPTGKYTFFLMKLTFQINILRITILIFASNELNSSTNKFVQVH